MSEASTPYETLAQEEEKNTRNTEELRTPVRSGRGTKRKCFSPSTPSGDADTSGPTKKRRKSASSTPLLKPALTERQQMALIMQMTDPQKQGTLSGGEESVTTTPRSEPSMTPRSRVQRRNERGETLLHTASIKGDFKTAATLIEQGAEVNATDNAGWTPLHEACNYGHTKVVSLLLEHQADASARGMEGDTPLHDATINGHLQTVKLLMEYNSNPHQENDQGLTPIDVCKDPQILRLLREGKIAHEDSKDESEEEDVFVSKEKTTKLSGPHLKFGRRGASQSVGDSYGDEESGEDLEKDHALYQNGRGVSKNTPEAVGMFTGRMSKKIAHTPKSRPRSALYSDLSSSDSDSEHSELLSRKSRGRKGRYYLAKMGEAKQKLLGKLEESGEGGDMTSKCEENVSESWRDDDEGCDSQGVAKDLHTDDSTVNMDPNSPEEEQSASTAEFQPQTTDPPSPNRNSTDFSDCTAGNMGMCDTAKLSTSQTESHTHPPLSVDTTGSGDIQLEPAISNPFSPISDNDDNDFAPSHKTSPIPSSTKSADVAKPDPCFDDVSPRSRSCSPPLQAPSPTTKTQSGDDEKNPQEELSPNPTMSELEVIPPQLPDSSTTTNDKSLPDTLSSLTTTSSSHKSTNVLPSSGEDEPAPTRLLRSAVRKSNVLPRQSGEGDEELVVSWSLSLVKRRWAASESGFKKDAEAVNTNMDHYQSGVAKKRHSSGEGSGPQSFQPSSDLEQQDPPRLPMGTLTYERCDSTSSMESRSSILSGKDSTEKTTHTKQGRKPQHVFSSRKISEKELQDEGNDKTDSLSISVDWGSLPNSNLNISKGTFPSSSAPPPHVVASGEKEDTTSTSTIISFPLVYSGCADSAENVVLTPQNANLQGNLPDSDGSAGSHRSSSLGRDAMETTFPKKVKTGPLSMEAVKPVLPGSGMASFTRDRGPAADIAQDTPVRGLYQDTDNPALPPKKRYRPIMKSSVIQRRKKQHGRTITSPAHLSSFLMFSGNYRSKQQLHPSNPKLVYPPLLPAMYKLFSEQENERIRLISSHLTEQDRLILCMEQELLRAHQRATKDYTPLSVCSVLMENMGYRGGVAGGCDLMGLSSNTINGMTSPSGNEVGSVDCKLLSGLVQDVWDKFQELRLSLLSRQRHEAEALWMVQRLQWTERRSELGSSLSPSAHDHPRTHVPIATPTLYSIQYRQ